MKIEEKIANLLKSTNKTLSVAESCSGGLLSNRLTNIAGSSKFLKLGIIAYSNEAKEKLLKIKPELIKKHGAVSEEISIAMATSVRKILNTDFGIGITGIAGPDGGTKSKPVGLVFITVATKNETLCLKCQFEGSRIQIKTKATTQALNVLSEFI